jgi:hypothetical protein
MLPSRSTAVPRKASAAAPVSVEMVQSNPIFSGGDANKVRCAACFGLADACSVRAG